MYQNAITYIQTGLDADVHCNFVHHCYDLLSDFESNRKTYYQIMATKQADVKYVFSNTYLTSACLLLCSK